MVEMRTVNSPSDQPPRGYQRLESNALRRTRLLDLTAKLKPYLRPAEAFAGQAAANDAGTWWMSGLPGEMRH
jgi:hypothetical protein